jgi:hypothetical protein
MKPASTPSHFLLKYFTEFTLINALFDHYLVQQQYTNQALSPLENVS